MSYFLGLVYMESFFWYMFFFYNNTCIPIPVYWKSVPTVLCTCKLTLLPVCPHSSALFQNDHIALWAGIPWCSGLPLESMYSGIFLGAHCGIATGILGLRVKTTNSVHPWIPFLVSHNSSGFRDVAQVSNCSQAAWRKPCWAAWFWQSLIWTGYPGCIGSYATRWLWMNCETATSIAAVMLCAYC